MKSEYDSIYLSPHLDDVALSCGARIFQETIDGGSVLIVTIMAGDLHQSQLSEFARSLHSRWQLAIDTVGIRRSEDTEACRILGADYFHWDVPDCVYRLHPETNDPLYSSEGAIFGHIHREESGLALQLSRMLSKLPTSKKVFVPLTVGGHIDHLITRAAAELWLNPQSLIYYEDYPYSIDENALRYLISKDHVLRPVITVLTTKAIEAKIKAIACYESQISTFFEDQEEMARQIREHSRFIGGERMWQFN